MYNSEYSKTNMTNALTNNIAQNFCFYFHYKYGLPLQTMCYIDNPDEIFFSDGGGTTYTGALGKLSSLLVDNCVRYKSYYGSISVNKEDLYDLVAYIKMQGEWRDEWHYFK